MGRMHYACDAHAEGLEEHTTAPSGAALNPLPAEAKYCCFCILLPNQPPSWATKRVKGGDAKCPPAHLPPGKLDEIADRAFDAAVEDWKE